MATIEQLYARIILDTNRDDMGAGGELEQALIDAVADAIEEHASEQFWFNRASGTVTTAAAQTVALPVGMRFATQVSYLGEPLRKVNLSDIEQRTETGVPCKWAEGDGVVHLWPAPDGAYSLEIAGVAELGVPDPETGNAWTTEANTLILNEAKLTLYAGPLRDAEGAVLAQSMRDAALSKLRKETRRRGIVGLVTDVPKSRHGFNVVLGW